MAFCRLVLPLVVSAICLLQSVYGADEPVSVPVFLWGDVHKSSAKYNPLSHLTGDKFEDLVKQETIDDPFVVVFIDQTLSVEDFSQKDADGKSSFPYLQQNIGKSIYIPSVESPVSVLSEIPDAEKVDRIDLNGDGLSAVIKPQSGKYLLINLKDAKEGESRTELLRRHNDFIEDLFPKLKDHYKKIIGIYTAHNAAWTVLESHNRVRRQAETAALAAYHYLDIEGLLLYANKINIHDGNNTIALPTTTPTATKTSNETDGTMDIKLNYSDTSLVLNFFSKGGYWFLNSIDLTLNGITETLSIQQELYAAEGFAYRCGNNVTYLSSNDTRPYSVEFQDLKVQPFFTGNGTAQGFGDSFNCVGFFSVPIWSCLFVVFILLSITFYGIMMMMDIRTMDRFDDPKGKTITINAGE